MLLKLIDRSLFQTRNNTKEFLRVVTHGKLLQFIFSTQCFMPVINEESELRN